MNNATAFLELKWICRPPVTDPEGFPTNVTLRSKTLRKDIESGVFAALIRYSLWAFAIGVALSLGIAFIFYHMRGGY